MQTYLNERIDEVLTGSSDPIVIRIFGNDLEPSTAGGRREGGHLEGRRRERPLRRVPGGRAADAGHGQARAAQRYGLKPGDVRRAAATMMESEEVGDIFRGGRAYDVHVWSTPATRTA